MADDLRPPVTNPPPLPDSFVAYYPDAVAKQTTPVDDLITTAHSAGPVAMALGIARAQEVAAASAKAASAPSAAEPSVAEPLPAAPPPIAHAPPPAGTKKKK